MSIHDSRAALLNDHSLTHCTAVDAMMTAKSSSFGHVMDDAHIYCPVITSTRARVSRVCGRKCTTRAHLVHRHINHAKTGAFQGWESWVYGVGGRWAARAHAHRVILSATIN
jgi:hypothetical protein